MIKKLLLFFTLLLTAVGFTGCDSKEASKLNSLPADQQKAVKNSIDYIKNFPDFSSKEHIDTDVVEIENAKEDTWKWLSSYDPFTERKEVDTSDWIITIGSTEGHNFAIIVCDSGTSEVIGYLPIK